MNEAPQHKAPPSNSSGTLTGLVFDIQGFSLHDGPGCRTLVFLSGCPLRCSWCANPEGLIERPRLMYREARCRQSHRCARFCPHNAIEIADDRKPCFDRDMCDCCDTLACVDACMSQALIRAGRSMTVNELMRILLRDSDYWGSTGGVTFSGGEPLAQPAFLLEVLARCRSSYLHTAVETSAHVEESILLEVLEHLDWLFLDLKHMDADRFHEHTGGDLKLVLGNIRAVTNSSWRGRVIVRVPVVPGFNDDVANLRATAEFIRQVGLEEVNLSPFHRLGASKYTQLGLAYQWGHQVSPTRQELRGHATIFEAAGLRCYADDETPF